MARVGVRTARVLAALIVAIGGPGRAKAIDYHVSPTGLDSAAGSAAAPWKTLQRAANQVGPGDRVLVQAGTYTGFHLTTSGLADAPIQFLAAPGVLINQRNATTPDGINLEQASYIVIDGFRVENMPRTGIRTVGNAENHAKFVTIRNSTGINNFKWGILTGHVDDLVIEHNLMANSQDEHGIYVSNSGDRPLVRGNLVYGNKRSGIQLNADASLGGDGVISDALIAENVIYNNGTLGGSALNFDGVQSSRVVNNLLYNNHASGISLYQIDGGEPAKNNVIVNNTIHQASDGRWAINIRDGSTGNTLLNNILVTEHPARGAVSVTADSLANFVSDSNVVTSRFTTTDGASTLSLAQWRTQTGQDLNSTVAAANDLFINWAAGDYRLKPQSAALNNGVTQLAPGADLAGVERPIGAALDRGAFEWNPAATAGDYNADGAVNAADFTRWRDRLGAYVTLPNDTTPGSVTTVDFAVWQANFSGSPASGASIPEPQALALFATILCLFTSRSATRSGKRKASRCWRSARRIARQSGYFGA